MPIEKPFAVEPLALGAVTTGNERTNRLALHLGEFADPGMVWQTTGNTNLWVRGDFGTAQEVDFVSLIGTNALAGTTARLRLGDTQAEVDGTADYDSAAQVIITPSITRKDGRYVWHWSLPSIFTKRWWRIDIGSHTGDFQAMALVLGKKMTFGNFYNGNGVSFGLEDMGELELGRFGVVSDTDGLKYRILSMDFGWMTDSDRFTKFQPLRDSLGSTGVAFWCFDPEATVQRQDKSYFGWLKTPAFFRPASIRQDRWQAQYEIRSMIMMTQEIPFCPRCGINFKNDEVIEIDGFRIDPRGQAFYNDRMIRGLSPTNVCVLYTIARAGGRLVTSDTLVARCCGESQSESRARVGVHEIRKVLGILEIPDPLLAVSARDSASGGYLWHRSGKGMS